MQFARMAWKFLVAIKDGLVLIAMLIFFAVLYGILSSRPNVASVNDGALLLDLSGVIVEESSQPDFQTFLTGDGGPMGDLSDRYPQGGVVGRRGDRG